MRQLKNLGKINEDYLILNMMLFEMMLYKIIKIGVLNGYLWRKTKQE